MLGPWIHVTNIVHRGLCGLLVDQNVVVNLESKPEREIAYQLLVCFILIILVTNFSCFKYFENESKEKI